MVDRSLDSGHYYGVFDGSSHFSLGLWGFPARFLVDIGTAFFTVSLKAFFGPGNILYPYIRDSPQT
jgi:hypothetical protein